MHIEKRKVGKRTKYYLSHSFREGSKVHKIRKFLGSDLSPEILEDRRKKAEHLIIEEIHRYKIIKDPLQIELSKTDLDFVKRLEAKIPVKIMHLSEKQWLDFSESFTYNTNAIEGSKLTDKEVKEVIEENKWPEKSKADIAEAYGVKEALDFIRTTKEHISLKLLKEIHKIVFKNSKKFAGEFRNPGEEVVVANQLGQIVHEGAPQSRIIALLQELIDWYISNKDKYPALILAAVVHNQFENIHPFADGNGRVGRIILNNILLKHNLPPINIELRNRYEYYASLHAYEKNHDLRPTLELFIKEYKHMTSQLG